MTEPRTEYADDRRGMMRVHIAQGRGDLACDRYSRSALRAHAQGHGVTASVLHKRDLATRMAYEGLIDADGYLRDGFPGHAKPTAKGAPMAEPRTEKAQAEAAWLRYRDEYQRANPWCDSRRLGRQMRKRDFIAGYLAALSTPTAKGADDD